MVTFDFEQSSEKSVLILSGKLKTEDAEDLKRVLQNSLTGTSRLTVDIDDVPEISGPCQSVFQTVIEDLHSTGKRLFFTGSSSEKINVQCNGGTNEKEC